MTLIELPVTVDRREPSSVLSVLLAAFVLLMISLEYSFAQSCHISGESYHLNSDSVTWSMRIAAGQNCIGGLRTRNATVDNVTLVESPQAGDLTLQGPGFAYKAKSEFEGIDSFTVLVSGNSQRIPGSSTIRVIVTVVDTNKPGAAAKPGAR